MKTALFTFFLLLMFTSAFSQAKEHKVYSIMVSLWPQGDNSPRYPRKKTQDTSLLANIIFRITAGQVRAYADSQFAKRMSVAEIDSIVKTKSVIDSLYYNHTPNGEEVIKIIQLDFDFFSITDYRILAMGKADVYFIGLGIDRRSVAMSHDERYGDPEPIPRTQTLFWVKYNEVSKIIDKYNAAHRSNQLTLRSKR